MSTAQQLTQQLQPNEQYTKNKLSSLSGLSYAKVKNLIVATGYDPDLKSYSGADLAGNFLRGVEYLEAGKSLEDIKIMLNVKTNGHFIVEEDIYTPEEKAVIDGKRDHLVTGIAEQLADDVFELIAGENEDPDSLAQEIAGKAKTALDRRFASVRSSSKRLLIELL